MLDKTREQKKVLKQIFNLQYEITTKTLELNKLKNQHADFFYKQSLKETAIKHKMLCKLKPGTLIKINDDEKYGNKKLYFFVGTNGFGWGKNITSRKDECPVRVIEFSFACLGELKLKNKTLWFSKTSSDFQSIEVCNQEEIDLVKSNFQFNCIEQFAGVIDIGYTNCKKEEWWDSKRKEPFIGIGIKLAEEFGGK